MLLYNLLIVIFYQAFQTAASCPETFVIKNVNWKNTPSGAFLHALDVKEINGKE